MRLELGPIIYHADILHLNPALFHISYSTISEENIVKVFTYTGNTIYNVSEIFLGHVTSLNLYNIYIYKSGIPTSIHFASANKQIGFQLIPFVSFHQQFEYR